jgi:hypothetical protein
MWKNQLNIRANGKTLIITIMPAYSETLKIDGILKNIYCNIYHSLISYPSTIAVTYLYFL